MVSRSWTACMAALLAAAMVASGGFGIAAEAVDQAAAGRSALRARADARIRKALNEPGDAEFVETPLQDVVDYLVNYHQIPIKFDHRALEEIAIDTDESITINIRGVSLRAILDLMLDELTLTWVSRHEVLLITTPERAAQLLETKVYDVADLVSQDAAEMADPNGGAPPGEAFHGPADFDSLIDVITSSVATSDWNGSGGPGSIVPLEAPRLRVLVVSQSQRVHEQIAALLADLRAVRDGGPAEGNAAAAPGAVPAPPAPGTAPAVPPPPSGVRARPDYAKIREALDKQVSLDVDETALRDAIDTLRDQVGVHIAIDRLALDEAGVDEATPVRLQVKDVSLRSALSLLAESAGVAWTVRNEVILVTSKNRAAGTLLTRVYDVRALAVPGPEGEPTTINYDELIDLLTSTVAPAAWDVVGGSGSMAPSEGGGVQALVVAATWQAHEALADLLAELAARSAGH